MFLNFVSLKVFNNLNYSIMKQVLNVISSPLRQSINRQKVFFKYLLILLLGGIAITASSFQKGNRIAGSQMEKLLNPSVPFTGKYTFDIQTNSGTGTGSHIGNFSIVEPNNSVIPNADGSLVVTGTAIITAANGDEIFATHSGLVTFENGMAKVDADFIITGGTGRFTGATGSFKSTLPLGNESFTFNGTISY
jgi:hypothetical protein